MTARSAARRASEASQFGMMDVSQAKRLRELERQNARLKKIVADQVLGMEILQEALEKKL